MLEKAAASVVFQRFFKKCSSHLKNLGASRVTYSKFSTENPQILDAAIQNSVTRASWYPLFVHPSSVGYLNGVTYQKT